MTRMSAGERPVMQVRTKKNYDASQDRPTEEAADCEPTHITASKVRVGMVVSVFPRSETDRPRKIAVRTIGYADSVLEIDGKKTRVRRIFFNGNGSRKFFPDDSMLLYFTPDPIRDGIKTKPLPAEKVTTEQEKTEIRAARERRRARLAEIVAKYQG